MATQDDVKAEINRALSRQYDRERQVRDAIHRATNEVNDLFKRLEYWVSELGEHVNASRVEKSVSVVATGAGIETANLPSLEIEVLTHTLTVSPVHPFNPAEPSYLVEGLQRPFQLVGSVHRELKLLEPSGLPMKENFRQAFFYDCLVELAALSGRPAV